MNAENVRPEKGKTPRWQKAFLSALRKGGIVGRACEAAKIGMRAVHHRREANEEFRRLWAEALDEAADRLESEADRRAYEGLLRKKFSVKGEPLIDPETGEQYAEREYSDTLLIFLLKGMRPAKYRDNHRHEHTGANGGPIEHVQLTVEQRRAGLLSLISALGERAGATAGTLTLDRNGSGHNGHAGHQGNGAGPVAE